MELEYNKKYLISSSEDIEKFNIVNSVKKYLVENLNKYGKFYVSLQGSKHNYDLLSSTLNNAEHENKKQNAYIENLYLNNKITIEDKINRLNELKKLQEVTKETLSSTIKEYEEWYLNYGNYDLLVIYLAE